VPTARQSRLIAAPIADVWAIVGDPHHLPRWWPRVERIEQATAGEFTEVLRSTRGRAIRADERLVELTEESEIAWEQLLEGTPFERLLAQSRTTIRLKGVGTATEVELERRQKMRGLARFGGFMMRRATRRLLGEALDGLALIAEVPAAPGPAATSP
jgi:uncharacterized protein YndB with AHSA1/START domain